MYSSVESMFLIFISIFTQGRYDTRKLKVFHHHHHHYPAVTVVVVIGAYGFNPPKSMGN